MENRMENKTENKPLIEALTNSIILHFPKDLCKLIVSYAHFPKRFSFPLFNKQDNMARILVFQHKSLGDLCLISSLAGTIYVYAASRNWHPIHTFHSPHGSIYRGMAAWYDTLLFTDIGKNCIHVINIKSQNEWTVSNSFYGPEVMLFPSDIAVTGNRCFIVDQGKSRVQCYFLSLFGTGGYYFCYFTFQASLNVPQSLLFGISINKQMAFVSLQDSQILAIDNKSNQSLGIFTKIADGSHQCHTVTDKILFTVHFNYLSAFEIKTGKLLKRVNFRYGELENCSGIYVFNECLFICRPDSVLAMHSDDFFSHSDL
jgi:hypothetical protein